MKVFVLTLCCLISLTLCSCTKEETTQVQSEREIGKYIYQDDNYIYHIDSECIRLKYGNDSNGHEIYGKHPIDTTEFVIKDKHYFRVCSRCVGDKEYEHLIRMSNRNSHGYE